MVRPLLESVHVSNGWPIIVLDSVFDGQQGLLEKLKEGKEKGCKQQSKDDQFFYRIQYYAA